MRNNNMRSIEFSGPDYTGKTTQAELSAMETQKYHAMNFGSFGNYFDQSILELSPQENFEWWFSEVTMDGLAEKLTDAYIGRYEDAVKSEADIAIFERGITMIQSQIAANFATRDCAEVDDYIDPAITAVERKLGTYRERDTSEVILRPNDEWIKSQGIWMQDSRNAKADGGKYSEGQREFYAHYLQNLQRALGILSDEDDAFVIDVDSPALDVNNRIRQSGDIFPKDMPSLFINDPVLLGISGLSESGKSSLAETLRRDHGFTRLKLGYFNESLRGGLSTYADPNAVGLNIVHFIATNRHIDKATFESVHAQGINSAMKLLVGGRWKSIYLDADRESRAARLSSNETTTEQAEKDQRKMGAGILRVREMADIVIGDSASAEESAGIVMNKLTGDETDMKLLDEIGNRTELIDYSECAPERCRVILSDRNGERIVGMLRKKEGKEPYVVLPGGGVENDDGTPVGTIQRELNEELGITKDQYILSDKGVFIDDEFGRQFYFIGQFTEDMEQFTLGGPEKNHDAAVRGTYEPAWFNLSDMQTINLVPSDIRELLSENPGNE